MLSGVPNEIKDNEYRVGIVTSTVRARLTYRAVADALNCRGSSQPHFLPAAASSHAALIRV